MTSAIGWMTACGIFGAIVANSADGETTAATSGLHPSVRMETTLGPVVIELDGDKAPRTVSNFVSYIENGFFDGTIFHRVLDGGLIQGGAFDATMNRKIEGLRDGVKCESDNGLLNVRIQREGVGLTGPRLPNYRQRCHHNHQTIHSKHSFRCDRYLFNN